MVYEYRFSENDTNKVETTYTESAYIARVVRALIPHYGADCPVVVAYRVSWPDERLIRGTLADIRDKVKKAGITRTALVLVGYALGDGDAPESRLYAPDHHHLLRRGYTPWRDSI